MHLNILHKLPVALFKMPCYNHENSEKSTFSHRIVILIIVKDIKDIKDIKIHTIFLIILTSCVRLQNAKGRVFPCINLDDNLYIRYLYIIR